MSPPGELAPIVPPSGAAVILLLYELM